MALSLVFFVYVDYTTEVQPRPFYVGKGNAVRVASLVRNVVHGRIAKKYGQRRTVVLETTDESQALDHERELIIEHRTYVNGGVGWWGANLTLGGEGVTGLKHSEESKERMSERRIAFFADDVHRTQLVDAVKRLWTDPVYRTKNMTPPPSDVEELRRDCETMPYDDVGAKHNVSSTTVKRWCRELGLQLDRGGVTHDRHAWTQDEESQLVVMHANGMLVRDIAHVLGIREGPVKKRVQMLCTNRSRFRRRQTA